MTNTKRLITIQGPTASGKTTLSILLAKYFNTEIISADSRQFYSEMNIGTAKPNKDELNEAKHHFIGSDSIHQLLNVAEYERRGTELLETLFEKNDNVILVGGSGLFVDALVNGLDNVPTDGNIRQNLIEREKKGELKELVQELINLDPEAEHSVDLKNQVRVIRALEVLLISGKPMRYFQNKDKIKRPFETKRFAIDIPREMLYQRINSRVDKMMEEGLLDEVKSLYPFKNFKSLETVGYSELFRFLDDEITLHSAVELIKQNSRRYAKRQMTWLRRTSDIHWLTESNTQLQFDEVINCLS